MPRFYKFLAADLTHHGLTYKEGLNIDRQPFNPSGECEPGGLYYTTAEHLSKWYSPYWPLIADVTIIDGTRVYAEPCGTKWKANQLMLSNIRPLSEFFASLNRNTVWELVRKRGFMLAHVKNQTHDICLAAVCQDGTALPFVQEQTDEICLAAVTQCSTALYYVHEQNEAICLAVVGKNGRLLPGVHQQTDAICLAAVRNYGYALNSVRYQTEEICLAAVQQCGNALRCVQKQTEAICLAAMQQDGMALFYVENQTAAICRAAIEQNPAACELVKITI